MQYIGYALFALFMNIFANALLPYINKGALLWSITGFVVCLSRRMHSINAYEAQVILVTVVACADPNYASADYVFRYFLNYETGWPDGIAWLLGLLRRSSCVSGSA